MKHWNNLDTEGQVRRSVHCAIGSAVIVVLCIIGVILYENKTEQYIDRCKATTTGTVISRYIGGKYSYAYYITAEYTVDGKEYKTKGKYASSLDIGDTVKVCYDPANPQDSYAYKYKRSEWEVILIGLAILFGLGCPAFLWQAKEIKQTGKITVNMIP